MQLTARSFLRYFSPSLAPAPAHLQFAHTRPPLNRARPSSTSALTRAHPRPTPRNRAPASARAGQRRRQQLHRRASHLARRLAPGPPPRASCCTLRSHPPRLHARAAINRRPFRIAPPFRTSKPRHALRLIAHHPILRAARAPSARVQRPPPARVSLQLLPARALISWPAATPTLSILLPCASTSKQQSSPRTSSTRLRTPQFLSAAHRYYRFYYRLYYR